MTMLDASRVKLSLRFEPGTVPKVDLNDLRFVLKVAGLEIAGKLSRKTARKMRTHRGAGCLQGFLVNRDGHLVLDGAGFLYAVKPAASRQQPRPESEKRRWQAKRGNGKQSSRKASLAT